MDLSRFDADSKKIRSTANSSIFYTEIKTKEELENNNIELYHLITNYDSIDSHEINDQKLIEKSEYRLITNINDARAFFNNGEKIFKK